MKKGLFSILAGALLVVGCQNYDDAFSNIESQITALASQVAGLSKVQSDLTALAGTVNSLQTSVADTVDAALADGLADIDAAVVSLEAATATAASSEDVAAIASAVAANQDDLTDLLNQSSVFSAAVVINSVASLNAYHAMGDGLKIVANDVTFNVKTDMDMVKVQEVADILSTITGNLSYTAATGVTTEAVFNNLIGTASLTLEQSGGYHFPLLSSATYVNLSDKFETSIVRVNFPALANITSIGTDSDTNDVVEFTKATSMNFAALKYYTPGTLSLKMFRGTAAAPSVMDISALDDVNALDVQTALNLTISGPNTVAIANLDGKNGSLTFDSVDSVTVTDYDGGITINAFVTSFTSNNVVTLAGTLEDVVNLDITGVIDPNNATTDKSGPAIAFTATQSDLGVVKLKGKLESVSLDNNDRLTTLWVYADVNKGSISITNCDDLTAIDLTASKASGVTLTNNDRLASVVINTTIQKSIKTGATLDGTIAVTGCKELESLTIGTTTAPVASVSVLTITDNAVLSIIDASNLTTLGATAASNKVNIYGNLFTVSAATDIANAAATTTALGAVGKVGDLGAFTTASGFATLKAYLLLAGANSSATANVYVDIVTSVISSAGVESLNDQTYSSTTTRDATTAAIDQKVLIKTANTADTGDAIRTSKRTFLLRPVAGKKIAMVVNGIDVLETAVTEVNLPAYPTSITLSLNQTLNSQTILDAATLALADVAGVTLGVTKHAGAISYIGFGANTIAAQNSRTVAGNAAFNIAVSDVIKIAIGNLSVTMSGTAYNGATNTGLVSIVRDIQAKWNSNYVTGLVKSATAVAWTLTSVANQFSTAGSTLTSPTKSLKFIAKDVGSPAIGVVPVVTITVASNTNTNLGYIIGNSQTRTNSAGDDGASGLDMLISITADTAGSTLGQIGIPGATQGIAVKKVSMVYTAAAGTGSTLPTELTSTYKPNITASAVSTALNIYPTQSRTDVINGEEANAAATSNAVDYTRVGWLAG